MSMSLNFYTMYGVIHNDASDDFLDFLDEHDEVYDDDDTPNILFDGMSGDYLILGEVLFDSGDVYDGGDADLTVIDVDKLPEIEAEYRKKFIAKFPEYKHLINKRFQLITLSHYH